MKVSEAKEKVCPFMSGQVSTGLEDIVFATVNCICGDCIAWKWDIKIVEIKEVEKIGGRSYPVERCKEVNSSEEGYCKRLGQ